MKDKRLKILFLPSWYPSEDSPVNGIFIKEHAKAVALYDEVVVLYTAGGDENRGKFYQKITDEMEEGIRTIRIKYRKSPIPKTTYFIYLWSITQAFRKLLNEKWKPDIIHAHVFTAGVPAVILGKLYKIPIVITEHWSGFPLRKLTLSCRIKARFSMCRAQVILTGSNQLRNAVRNYGIKNRFKVVPNVVNLEIFFPVLQQNKSDKKRILLVALLSHVKGIPYLLEAISQLRRKRDNFVLDIVGNGPNRIEYEELSKNLGLADIVKFHGLKTKSESAKFMRRSSFFVQPSLCETFNVVCIEAMACGKPIIATQLSVFQEKITKDIGILVPPKDTDALVKAIDYMLDHYQDYSSKNISQYAKDNFSYEVVGQQIDNIYREILNYA